MITARYRRDYDGEFVITNTRLVDGVKQETREWIPNTVINSHISGRAAIIGSRFDQAKFRHQRLERHRGGLLGRKRLQTYAWGDLWNDMRLDFYASTDRQQLSGILQAKYDLATTIFTSASCVMEWPGHFYPVPFSPYLSDPALALYLASFDQHEEVFLLGYNQEVVWPDKNVLSDLSRVMAAYRGTQYISVAPPSSQPNEWLDLPNFRTMPLRQFISYCDI